MYRLHGSSTVTECSYPRTSSRDPPGTGKVFTYGSGSRMAADYRLVARARDLARNPWLLAATVAAVVIVTITLVATRHLRTVGSVVEVVDDLATEVPDEHLIVADLSDVLMSDLHVALGTDGTIRVHGIPDTLDADVRGRVAHTAAQAAERRLETLIARGRPLNPHELQSIDEAARIAVAQSLEGRDQAA